ncbi:MAG: hypothetical protein QM817_40105 [Archangium sp.]
MFATVALITTLLAQAEAGRGEGLTPVTTGPTPRPMVALQVTGMLGQYGVDPPGTFDAPTFLTCCLGVGADGGVQWLEWLATTLRFRGVFIPDASVFQFAAMAEFSPIDLFTIGVGAGGSLLTVKSFTAERTLVPLGAACFPLNLSFNFGVRLPSGHRLGMRATIDAGLHLGGDVQGISPWIGGSVGAVLR